MLLAYGYLQTRDRVIPRWKLTVLPIVMIGLSLYGVISAFGLAAMDIIMWLTGTLAAALICLAATLPRGTSYCRHRRSYSLPGSWLPLVVMMLIFFTKYTVAVLYAREQAITAAPLFATVVSLCYGLFSGFFLGRAMTVIRSRPSPQQV